MERQLAQTELFSISAYDGSLDVDNTDLTPAANEILTGSSDLCSELKHSRVEPCHVAYQLFIGHKNGVGAQILTKSPDIDREAAAAMLKKLVSDLPTGTYAFNGRGVTFSQEFVDLLKKTRQEQQAAAATAARVVQQVGEAAGLATVGQPPVGKTGKLLVAVEHIGVAVCNQLAEHCAPVGLTATNVRNAVAQLKLGRAAAATIGQGSPQPGALPLPAGALAQAVAGTDGMTGVGGADSELASGALQPGPAVLAASEPATLGNGSILGTVHSGSGQSSLLCNPNDADLYDNQDDDY
eukprot:SAG22_NODE_2636_length_2348_cov_2.162739_1_plen_296_part_00